MSSMFVLVIGRKCVYGKARGVYEGIIQRYSSEICHQGYITLSMRQSSILLKPQPSFNIPLNSFVISPSYRLIYQKYQDEKEYLPHTKQAKQLMQKRLYFQSLIIALNCFSFIALTYQLAYQKYQDEKVYLSNIKRYQQKQLSQLQAHHSSFILFTSLRVLLKLSKFIITPKNNTAVEKPKNIIALKLTDFSNIAILPPKPALKIEV